MKLTIKNYISIFVIITLTLTFLSFLPHKTITGMQIATCGNGLQDTGESCFTCPQDIICPEGSICQEDGRCLVPSETEGILRIAMILAAILGGLALLYFILRLFRRKTVISTPANKPNNQNQQSNEQSTQKKP